MPSPIVEEHHYDRADREDTSVMATVLALLAVLLILGFALYVFRVYPFNAAVNTPGTTNDINITAPDVTPVNPAPVNPVPVNP